jgi:HSP20 family molecular chaperone IbpA
MSVTIDEAIERVEQLYHVLTGTRPPASNGQRVAFPPEVDPIVHVHEQLGGMLDRVDAVISSGRAWTPRALMYRDGEDIVFAVDVPGVRREELQIRVAPDSVTVVGRRAAPPRPPIASDAPVGAFTRSFPLLARVSPEHVSARLDDGVLAIRIHPSPRTQPSQIMITS